MDFRRTDRLGYLQPVRISLSQMAAMPRRIGRNTSAATRLSLVVVLVALISLVVASVVGLQRGSELADQVIRDRLSTIAASRADQVERYVDSLRRAAIGQAMSPSTADALEQFGEAYTELQAETPSPEDASALADYYRDVVAPELEEVRDRPVSAASLAPSDPAAVHLQASYIVPAPGDDDTLIAEAGDGSRWSEVHGSLAQSFDEFVIRNEVDDLYLIAPDNNTIVYSTSKDIDFATSLLVGPQSGSALAELIGSFDEQPEPGSSIVTDFTRYTAANDEPSAFVASPVIEDGTLVGFVALRIGADRVSSITTNDGSWQNLGSTGETYLVAGDDRMRSDARGFVEDPARYLDTVSAAGTATENEIRLMEVLETTTLFQPVNGDEVDAALTGEPGLVEATSYLGTEVLSAYQALDIDGLDWAVFAAVDRLELDQPTQEFVRDLLIAIALFIVAITFVAVRWSNRLLDPLRIISTHLRAIRVGGDRALGPATTALPDDSPREFAELATDIDTMLATLSERNAAAAERASERRDLVRRLLPPQIVRRAEAGEQDVLDQVSNATVAVVVIHGIGGLMRAGSADHARGLIDRFVEEADGMAKQRGLDRLRLTGDAYYAACGTLRPYLDHAQRAVSFVLDIRELIRDLAADIHGPITMSAGLDSGPVTVGLTGGSRLVYDSWGVTVQTAADLARRARPDQVLASAATLSQLPSRFITEDYTGTTDSPGVAIVSGLVSEGQPVR